MVALTAQDDDVGVHERAVRGDDELDVGEALREIAEQLPLPGWMQVQIDLVDEDHRRFREGVLAVGVTLVEAAGEVDHPREQGLVAEAQALEGHPAIGRIEQDTGAGACRVIIQIGEDLDVLDLGQQLDEHRPDRVPPGASLRLVR
ncbi:hypothetical protein WME95_08140 [Sorangium sp. So ce327]